jgi:hypothetical protein
MSNPQSTNASRRLVSILVMLSLLGVFLSMYFLKYVPDQKREYNQRAFRELQGVADAFLTRSEALEEIDSASTLAPDDQFRWNLSFQKNNTKKSLDSILLRITAGDRDVFDNYLMILDEATYADSSISGKDTLRLKGEIVYNPDRISIGNSVCPDTLLKRINGFSLQSIHDVKVEGNDFKLFLYPFRFHRQTLIMAGLLSFSNYASRYQSVSIDFITTGVVILLLLLLALPIVKIFIIGSKERITQIDLRAIIGTYFAGAFVLFFLMVWIFLEGSQTSRNHRLLGELATQLEDSLYAEIRTAGLELKKFDRLYSTDSLIRAQLGDTGELPRQSDRRLHPEFYRQLNDVFWMDSMGKWIARYGFMHYDRLPLESFSDRQYFKDLKAGSVLHIRGVDSFCLQPTISRLTGSFVVNMVIPSHTANLARKQQRALMIGMAGQMYSVCNTVLPPGYGFSIVDKNGTILFDTRERSLLTTVYNDLSDQETIQNCVQFRQQRFLKSTRLHGAEVAMMATPMQQLPYTTLVFYDLEKDQQFLLHVLGLSCLFIGTIILLLLFSGYCNEWARKRSGLSAISSINFNWLRPVPEKTGYYHHLLTGIYQLAGTYGFCWLVFQWMGSGIGAYQVVISVLFPFYLAIYYVLLREKQNSFLFPDIRASLAGAAIPCLVIIAVMSYVMPGNTSYQDKALIIVTQCAFAGLIYRSLLSLKPKGNYTASDHMLSLYSQAIVAGVLLTVIIPAAGVFSFFYKEETRMRLKTETLITAGLVEDRKDSLTARLSNYSFDLANAADNLFLQDRNFHQGIYLAHPIDNQCPLNCRDNAIYCAIFYSLHNFLYPRDSAVVAFRGHPDEAADNSWFFFQVKDSVVLVHTRHTTFPKDTIRMGLSPVVTESALGLVYHNAVSQDAPNVLLITLVVALSVGLFYWLTRSLATRIFLLKLFTNFPAGGPGDPIPGWTAHSIRGFENQNPDYNILYAQTQLTEVYHRVWNSLSDREKFILYDFATDRLTNYKSGMPLFTLIQSGILYIGEDKQLHFMTRSFHNYVLSQSDDNVIVDQMKLSREGGAWQKFRLPLSILLTAAGLFVFLTQDAIFQKITGLFTSLGAIVPIIQQLFVKSNK